MRKMLNEYYIPTCPMGITNCVCDPAYILAHNPAWYKEIYGNLTPEQAIEECMEWTREKVELRVE